MAAIGLITINGKRIIEVDADPTSSGVAASVGSIALFDDSGTGKFFVKTGAGDTAWTEGAGGGLESIVEDTTPQLGGDLDTNGFNIGSADDATADANPTESIVISSGDKTAGTGDSGSLTLQTGTSAGGARGSVTVSALELNMSFSKIVSLADPTNAQDAATKNYADTTFLALAGGTMSGGIAMGTNQITGLGDPSLAQDAATKNYVDTTALLLAGGTMTGNIAMGTNSITGLADPVNAQDAATKNYVDSVAAGLDPKESVRVATTDVLSGTMIADDGSPATGERSYNTSSNTINWFASEGPTAIDGINLVNGDRILVKNESATSGPAAGEGRIYNGVYIRTSQDVWTRASDFDGSPTNEISGGNFVFVELGTVNESRGYVLQGDGVLTLQTDNIIFVQFSDANVDLSGYATNALDNLASVAINTSLISDTALTDDLGSQALPWNELNIGTILLHSAASTPVGQLSQNAGNFWVEGLNSLNLFSSDNGAGNSGDVNIYSGTATGTRGTVNLDGSAISMALNNVNLNISEFDESPGFSMNFNLGNLTSGSAASPFFIQAGSVRSGADASATGGYMALRGGDIRDNGVTGTAGEMIVRGGDVRGSASGTSGNAIFSSGNVRPDASNSVASNTGDTLVKSGDVLVQDGNSGATIVATGNTAGAGNSGDLVLRTGDSTSGSRGSTFLRTENYFKYFRGSVGTPSALSFETGETVVLTAGQTGIVGLEIGVDEVNHAVMSFDIIGYDVTTGDSNVYKRTAHVKRLSGGNVSVVLVSSDFTSEEDTSWNVDIVANTVNQTVEVQLDGDASNSTDWTVLARISVNV